MNKIKLKRKISFFIFTLLFFPKNSFATIPVIDYTLIGYILQVLQSSQQQLVQIEQITDDIDKWRNLNWNDSKHNLDLLASEMENANSLATDVSHAISYFQYLYPGYESEITDFNSSFEKRNKALLSFLQSEIVSTDAAHAINSQNEKNILIVF